MTKKTKDTDAPVDQNDSDAADAKSALFIRVNLASGDFIGPGKVRLMELIDQLGSISAAGRVMGMSYRRAWMLIDSANRAFTTPLVVKQMGGSGGGGAAVTELGREIIQRYRRIERDAANGCSEDLLAITHAARQTKPDSTT
ncbi:MAG: LysR family transcriptional regulator [Hyphomicrobiales bacterium]|nr:LysR family transcriptional regulator [Hyphomicrobiales bacterium]